MVLLAACGGGGGDDAVALAPPVAAPSAGKPAASAPAAVATALSGTVAVGAPITDGRLRILDADGAVVAADVAVDADGRYAAVPLTGPAPWRLEACGYAGANYRCVYSAASAGGTAQVTPLTTAAVLLATGQTPETLMSGTAPALTTATMAAAQDTLRAGLAGVLQSAGVPADFDFVSGALAAGSRSGYDGVLDAVGVTVGQDTAAFVQITPRLGEGNLYMEQNRVVGSVTAGSGAAALGLSGLDGLFARMSDAMASAAACTGDAGLRSSLSATAHMTMGDQPAQGPADVAAAMCGYFAEGEQGTPMWGSRLLSPTLGRCDVSGVQPVCGVSFVLQSPEGDVEPVGTGLAVTQENGEWKFAGDLLPMSIQASARAQRSRRLDGAEPVDEYDRALAFEVAALPGLACARVAQRDGQGALAPIGYFKRHPGATEQPRLALWTADGFGNGPSLDPLVGATRNADDTWVALPQGDAGDAVVRNFYLGGRTVSVSLYADGACSLPFLVDGKPDFDVEVEGVPPVWSAMQSLPWPEIDAASGDALRTLALDSGARGSLHAAWSFPRGPLGIRGTTVCASRGDCGQGGSGRLGERDLRPGTLNASLTLDNRGAAVGADDSKTLALYGSSGEGVRLQSNYGSCPQAPAGEACR